MFQKTSISTLFVTFTLTAALVTAQSQDWRSGIPWKKPEIITPGAKPGDPPSDAIILFNGTDMSEWDKEWKIENGELVCVPGRGDIRTKKTFGSIQLHLEFATPSVVSGRSQGRGNSGVFFGPYEVQILDSYDNETYYDGQCASIYKQTPPIVNACRPPGEWQTYDIIFNRPELKIEDGVTHVIRPGYITVIHNGVLVVNRHELWGSTFFHRPSVYEAHPPTLPIRLQDHGNDIRFRNIWVREIPDTNVRPEATRAPYFQ
jgi:hypothetical protein